MFPYEAVAKLTHFIINRNYIKSENGLHDIPEESQDLILEFSNLDNKIKAKLVEISDYRISIMDINYILKNEFEY